MRRIWLDVETSGLDLDKVDLLEVGIVIADVFDVIAQKNWVMQVDPSKLIGLRPRVMEMHTKNGLFAEILANNNTYELADAEQEMIEFCSWNLADTTTWKLAGSSIAFDRTALVKWMPLFENRLHYRMLDVSSIKESLNDWSPQLVEARPDPQATHRAVPDCLDSLNEWKYYHSVLIGDC